TDDVGLDELERVVLGRRHLLQRRGVDDVVNPLEGALEPILVAHVAQEEAQDLALGAELLRHGELLELVAAEDDDPPWGGVLQQQAGQLVAERPGAAGDEDGLAAEELTVQDAINHESLRVRDAVPARRPGCATSGWGNRPRSCRRRRSAR